MTNSLSGHREERRRAKKVLPDQGITRVKIDAKTYIFIKKGQDPEERKRIHLEGIEKFRNNSKD